MDQTEADRLRAIADRAESVIDNQNEIALSGTPLDERALGVRRAVFHILGIDYQEPPSR